MSEKLLFISVFDYPTRYAHAVHGRFMAQAFATLLGENFLYFVNEVKDPVLLSGIKYRRFFGPFGRRIKKLRLRRVLIPISLLWFFLAHHSWRKSVVFANDPALFSTLFFLKKIFRFRLVVECHSVLPRQTLSRIAREANGIVFLTHALKRAAEKEEASLTRSIVLPNAVDIERFDTTPDDKEALRTELSLPTDKILVGYMGRFVPTGEDKGLSFMIESLTQLPKDILFLFVGGAKREIEEYRAYAISKGVSDRVILVPHVDSTLVPRYAKACDILTYVPEGTSAYFTIETSPMKLFEYMAARRPIIVSDIPTIREILDGSTAHFIQPGSAEEFSKKIIGLSLDLQSTDGMVGLAYERVRQNTWEARVQKITAFTK